jgi:hypothetical protein
VADVCEYERAYDRLREDIRTLIREHDDPETGAACKGHCECFGVRTLRELLDDGS